MSLWGGRFQKKTDELVAEFTSSIDIDQRLWRVDIRASIVHAQMLGRQGILSSEDAAAIEKGLLSIADELEAGKWHFDLKAEDIHGELERRLFEKIGEAAKRLHTARSRNDQIATDTRLVLAESINDLTRDLKDLQGVIVSISEAHTSTIMPGMTHLQHAQPVSLAHHLLAYFWMFERDIERLRDSLPRVLTLPLGSAALAGTGFPIDRKFTAEKLGFTSVSANSLDAVSDRDFVIEFLSSASIIMMHLSRLCEELILWSTPEFGFVELSDVVTTGSSIMPQKKNPDVAELIRGRVGRLYGALMGSLTMMKALPLAYNRDMQEDKVHLFQGLDAVWSSVRLMGLMLTHAGWRPARMAASLKGDFSNATDLADDLVEKGISFRRAHEIVGHIVRECIEKGVGLEDLKLADLKRYDSAFDQRSVDKLSHQAVLAARQSEGGTAPSAVLVQIQAAKEKLNR